jgi:valyl-tRNA synthetase
MSREEFLKHVWQWKNKCGDRIYQQLASIDKRAAFIAFNSSICIDVSGELVHH